MNPVHKRDKPRSALHFPHSVVRSHQRLPFFKKYTNSTLCVFFSFTGSKSRWEGDPAFYSFGECRRNYIWAGWVCTSVQNMWYYSVFEKGLLLVIEHLALFCSTLSPYRRSEAFPYCPRQNFRGHFPWGEKSANATKYVLKRMFSVRRAIKHFGDGFNCRMLLRFARPSWHGTHRKFVSPSLPSPKIHLSESYPRSQRTKESWLPNIRKCWPT